MTAITEQVDASSALVAPPPAAAGDYINQLRSNAGLVLGSLDSIAQKAFGISLIQELVEPFAGDWASLETAAGGWERVGAALKGTSANFAAGAAELTAVWQGEAASAAAGRMQATADGFTQQAEGCAMIAEQCRAIIQVAQSAGNLLATGLGVISDILMQVAAELAVPVVGWAVGAALSPVYAAKIFSWVNRITRALRNVIKFINVAIRVVATLQKMIAVGTQAMGAATAFKQAQTGLLIDDVAGARFGG